MELKNFVQKYSERTTDGPYAGANGVYVIAPSCPAQFWDGEKCGNNVPKNVKIGRASGEHGFATKSKGRLQSYRTYWPNGVTVHAVLITPSFDPTVHTYKDEALRREVTLRRIFQHKNLSGFGSNGHGKDNGTGKLGSEWIRLTPSQIMNYLIAAGPVRNSRDQLYGCTRDACQRVDIEHVSRNTTRLSSVVNALEYVLRYERDGRTVGIPGRPAVLPRTFLHALRQKSHPLHKYVTLLQSNINKDDQRARARIDDKKQREINAILATRQRMTRAQTRQQQKRVKYIKKREPRNLAAIRPSEEWLRAKKQKITPRNTVEQPNTNQTLTHREVYDREKKETAALHFCTRGKVLQTFSQQKYVHVDVTGDGRCYFYAIMKALDFPLRDGAGHVTNALDALNYIDPHRRDIWEQFIRNGNFGDPIDVLFDSVKLVKMLYAKGILYIVRIKRTRKDLKQVKSYVNDPTREIQKHGYEVYQIISNGSLKLLPELATEKRRSQSTVKFQKAFDKNKIITFVWVQVNGHPHYEIVLPK